MDPKYPCKDCIVKTSCSQFCDEMLNYYKRLIRSYAKYGDKSLLFKYALEQDVKYIDRIKKQIPSMESVLLRNNLSKERYLIYSGGFIHKFRSCI